jgi:hypothetical protein
MERSVRRRKVATPRQLGFRHAPRGYVDFRSGQSSAIYGGHVRAEPPAFTFVLVKLASRCNIDCTTATGFATAVYDKPPALGCRRGSILRPAEQHIRAFRLTVSAGLPRRRAVAVPEISS